MKKMVKRGMAKVVEEDFSSVFEIISRRRNRALHAAPDAQKRNSMMRHFGEALSDIVMPDLTTAETESSLEINFLIGKLKHTVRRVKKAGGDSEERR